MRAINLNDYNYLVHNDLVMKTKKGMPWRCGKGFRRDWNKLIGMAVMFSGKPYTLSKRVKKNNRWYLVLKDNDLVMIKRQDVVTMKSTECGKQTTKQTLFISAPVEMIDLLVGQAKDVLINRKQYVLDNPLSYKKDGGLRVKVKEAIGKKLDTKINRKLDDFLSKLILIKQTYSQTGEYDKSIKIMKKLLNAYHPDKCKDSNATEYTRLIIEEMRMIKTVADYYAHNAAIAKDYVEKAESAKKAKQTEPKSQSTTKKKSNDSNKSKKGRIVEMVDLDTGEVLKVFDCTGDANEYFGKRRSATSINNCILGKSKQAYGYKWRYAS